MKTISRKLGAYQFVSVNELGNIGSIYYQKGRIRLVYKNGPTIEFIEKDLVCTQYIAKKLQKKRQRLYLRMQLQFSINIEALVII